MDKYLLRLTKKKRKRKQINKIKQKKEKKGEISRDTAEILP